MILSNKIELTNCCASSRG